MMNVRSAKIATTIAAIFAALSKVNFIKVRFKEDLTYRCEKQNTYCISQKVFLSLHHYRLALSVN